MATDIAIVELFNAVKTTNLEHARNVLEKAKKELQVAYKIQHIRESGRQSLKLIDEIIAAVLKGDIKEAKEKCSKAEPRFNGHVKIHLERKLKEIEEVTGLPKDFPGQNKKKQEAHNTSFKSTDRVDDIQHPNDKTNRAQLPNAQSERDHKEENDQVAELRQSGRSDNKDSKPQNGRDYKEENDQVAELRQSGRSENKDSKPQNGRYHKEENDQVAELRQNGRSENRDSKPTETYNNRSSASENNSKLERSKLASFRMRQNNPDIADLSDPNRPTKIAERFSELYDNEWTEAFEELIRKDSEAIAILLSVVTEAYKFCTDAAEKQIKVITKHWNAIFEFGPGNYKNEVNDLKWSPSSKSPNYSTDGESLVIQYRKKIASKALQRLKDDFTDGKMTQITGKAHLSAKPKEFTKYAQKAVELTWWMCVQDPPIFLCPPTKDEVFDKNLYKAYTKTGTKPQFFVWPALRLHKEGGILIKGVVQFE